MKKTKIFSNSIYLLADFAAITILAFGFWFILGRLLTPAETGIVFTSWGISSILSVVSLFGLSTAVAKLVSESKNENSRKALIQIAYRYTVISNLVIFFTVLLLYQYFASLFQFPFLVTLFTALNIFIISLNTLASSVLNGFQEMKRIFTSDLIGYLLKAFGVLVFIYLGLSYLGPLAALAGTFLLIFLLRVKSDWFSFKQDFKTRKSLFHYAFPSFISSIAAIIFTNIQYIILTIVKNPTATGIFGYAMLVSSPLYLIPITLGTALFPIVSHLSSSNSKKIQSYLTNLVIRYSALIILPLGVFLAYFSKQFFTIFFPQYMSATALLPFLIPGAILYGISNIFILIIFAAKQPIAQRNIVVLITILFVILAIPLTQMLSATGLALAYLLANLFALVLSYYYVKKFINFKIQIVPFIKLFLASAIFFGFLVYSDFLATAMIVKILFILVGFAIYIATLFLLQFYIKEDIQVLRALVRRFPFMQKQLFNLIEFVEERL